MRFFLYLLTIVSISTGNLTWGETLKLHVNHLRSFKGNLMIFLWSNPDAYLMKNNADYRVIVDLEKPENSPVNGIIEVKIESLTFGPYAMMVYHDENKSYDFERNFLGIPLEGFAFGNNAKPNLGAPKFQEASINLTQPEVHQRINILY